MVRWTAEDIPDLTGRTAVVTGANSGLGFPTSLELARRGATVILAGRDAGKGRAAVDALRREAPGAAADWQTLDLAELASVRRFADAVAARGDGLDLLVNNAGVMALPYQRTADGFEFQLGVNHLGHFALTGLLLPALLARPAPRVVTVSSRMHRSGRIDFDDLQSERRYGRGAAYSRSKLANLLFTLELQRRADAAGVPLVSVAAHPGFAATNLGTSGSLVNRVILKPGMRLGAPPAAGALPSLYAATAPDVAGGEFFGPAGFRGGRGAPRREKPAARASDEAAARRLWDVSEQLTGVRFDALTRRAGH
jgi:NAD(P)-dependent dehydrogenase (short-subunit alcohol dehydrogenase family)